MLTSSAIGTYFDSCAVVVKTMKEEEMVKELALGARIRDEWPETKL